MQRKLFFLLMMYIFTACNSNTGNQTSNMQSQQDSNATVYYDSITPLLSCYAYTHNGDTIQLKITSANNTNTFTGRMLYQLKEKDRNTGTLQGTIKGDTLIADYAFSSEGRISVRQVAFLKQADKLREGFGELKETDGKVIFTNTQALQFSGFALIPVACNQQF